MQQFEAYTSTINGGAGERGTRPGPARRRPMSKPHAPRRLEVEPLEERAVPAGIYATLRGGVLSVSGTEYADTIVLRQTPGGVTLDEGRYLRLYVGVSRVEVVGRGGND